MANNKSKLKIQKKTLLLIDWANVYGWRKSLKCEVCPKKLYKFLNRPKIINKMFFAGTEVGQEKSENFIEEMRVEGYCMVTKNVKFLPILLNQQTHFKKTVKDIFNLLDDIKQTNSIFSNKLYDLKQKVEELSKTSVVSEKEDIDLSNKKDLNSIFELIEELDIRLTELNDNIARLQGELKKPVSRRKCDFDVEITMNALKEIDNYETLLLFSGDGDYYPLVEELISKGKKVILVFAKGQVGKEYDVLSESKNSLFYALPVKKIINLIKK